MDRYWNNLTFDRFERFNENRRSQSTQSDGQQSVQESITTTSDGERDDRRKEFDSFLEFAQEEFKKMDFNDAQPAIPIATVDKVPSAAEASFLYLLDKFGDLSCISDKPTKRRFLMWNSGSIHGAGEDLKLRQCFIELIEKIRPHGILSNELRLKYHNVKISVDEVHAKLNSSMNALCGGGGSGYCTMALVPTTKKSKKYGQSKGGSAIFIRNDMIEEFSKKDAIKSSKFGYEVASVFDKTLEIYVYCCYVRKRENNVDLSKWIKEKEKGVGGGDFNLVEFTTSYSNLENCTKKEYVTHKHKYNSDETRIDHVFKFKSIKNIEIIVHEPLKPKSEGCGHYPIVFDVIRTEGESRGITACSDPKCGFLCNR
ncbi:hypothetical protein PMAYCL1PPCAC_10722, partial [Pristionchus mayeri]